MMPLCAMMWLSWAEDIQPLVAAEGLRVHIDTAQRIIRYSWAFMASICLTTLAGSLNCGATNCWLCSRWSR